MPYPIVVYKQPPYWVLIARSLAMMELRVRIRPTGYDEDIDVLCDARVMGSGATFEALASLTTSVGDLVDEHSLYRTEVMESQGPYRRRRA